MRMIFGVLSLLFVVAVIAFMSKKQMSSINEIKVPGAAASSPAPAGNVQQQSQQIQQQFKAAAEAAVQQARPVPDEK
jgi:Na+-transporting methylmalonyl-CoA/oxaloacetate decarboxylase gamma subunit